NSSDDQNGILATLADVIIGRVPFFPVDRKWTGESSFQSGEIRLVLCGPPFSRAVARNPVVEEKPNIDVTICSVVPTHPASKEIDGRDTWRRFYPIREDFSQSSKLIVEWRHLGPWALQPRSRSEPVTIRISFVSQQDVPNQPLQSSDS